MLLPRSEVAEPQYYFFPHTPCFKQQPAKPTMSQGAHFCDLVVALRILQRFAFPIVSHFKLLCL